MLAEQQGRPAQAGAIVKAITERLARVGALGDVETALTTGVRAGGSRPAVDLREEDKNMGVGARLLALTTCGLLLAVAGCSGDEPAPEPPGASVTSAAPSPTVDPAEAKARADALAVYAAYRTAYQAAVAKADFRSKDLPKYVAEPLLGQVRNAFSQMNDAGVISRGESIWNGQAVDVQLDAEPPVVTIEDCRDTSAVVTVDRKTGKPAPAPSNQAKKYIVVSKAKQVDGTWYVFESTGDRSRTC
ncbi:hypothetical protein [Micromonospora aurantiaca (nom. illeg.)]|uniref:hypothetical protein n=1 Tax=Micromonospora aurantiaca (nom. illeg.) TaxID=47850 RepID=UPI0033FFEF18